MASINQVYLLGRIGQEPQYTEPNANLQVAKLSIATSRKNKDKEVTQWHNVVCFGNAAKFVQKYVHKGDIVSVIGEVNYNTYKNKQNEDVKTTDIIVNNIQLVAQKERKDNMAQSAQTDDLPFDNEF